MGGISQFKFNICDLTYSEIQNTLISQIISNIGFDGMTSQLDGKTFVFVDQDKVGNEHAESYIVDPNVYEAAWTVKGVFDILDWNEWTTGRVPEKSGIVTQNELDIVTNSL